MTFSNYDMWKLATPPEYEREESGAPAAGKKKRRGGIPPGEYCPGCGGISTGVHLDRTLLPKEEEDVPW